MLDRDRAGGMALGPSIQALMDGAGDGIRTRDTLLGRQELYH